MQYNPIGRHDFRRLLKPAGALSEEQFLEFYIPQCESRMGSLHRLSLERGWYVAMGPNSAPQRASAAANVPTSIPRSSSLAKIIMIVDLQGVSLWNLSAKVWVNINRVRY